MTEENKNQKIPAYVRYAMAEAAETMDNAGMMRIALDQIEWSDDMKTYIAKANPFRTEEGIKEASQIYSIESQIARNSAKISDLKEFYSEGLSFLSDENKAKVDSLYSNIGDSTLGDILSSYKSATSTIKLSESLKDKFKPEEIEAAKKEVEKYENFINLYQNSHAQKIGSLKRIAESEFEKKSLEALVMNLPEAPKQKEEKSNKDEEN
jgi:hypothetical protein